MDADAGVNYEALERTAAWVRQVSLLKDMKHTDDNEEEPHSTEDIEEQDEGRYKGDEQFHSIYEALKHQFNTSPLNEIDIPTTVKDFKERLEKYGISQRFAAKHIMEKTSQGNLSFLLDKGRHKHWQELSPRGRVPYVRMRSWLENIEEQNHTLAMLQKSKEYKKTGPKDGGGRREKFTVFQLMVLCRFFEEDPNPNISTRNLLAEKLGAPVDRITIWFQNQRARGFPAKKMLSQTNFNNMKKQPAGTLEIKPTPSKPKQLIGQFLNGNHGDDHLTSGSQSNSLSLMQLSSHFNPSPLNNFTSRSASASASSSEQSAPATVSMAAHAAMQYTSRPMIPLHGQGQGHIGSPLAFQDGSIINRRLDLVKKEFYVDSCKGTKADSCSDTNSQPLNLCDSTQFVNQSINFSDLQKAHDSPSDIENNQPLNFTTVSHNQVIS